MKRVVVVEDEALVRRGIVLAVDWASVDCVVVGEAENGQEGLALIREKQPDLIVTDIKMPVMDGLEMLHKARDEGSTAKVIFLTAYSDFAYAQSALKLGAADYLLKPFHDGELEAAVERLTARPAPESTPAAPPTDGKRNKYVAEAIRYLEEHYGDAEIGVGTVAEHLGLSEGHLSHLFKEETGQTMGAFLTQTRIRAAMALLRDCRSKVYLVAEQVGYRDITYFSSTFKKIVGMSPSDYQKTAEELR